MKIRLAIATSLLVLFPLSGNTKDLCLQSSYSEGITYLKFMAVKPFKKGRGYSLNGIQIFARIDATLFRPIHGSSYVSPNGIISYNWIGSVPQYSYGYIDSADTLLIGAGIWNGENVAFTAIDCKLLPQ